MTYIPCSPSYYLFFTRSCWKKLSNGFQKYKQVNIKMFLYNFANYVPTAMILPMLETNLTGITKTRSIGFVNKEA